MGRNLGTSVKIGSVASTAAGTSTINGPTIDMKGFDSVLFFAMFATPAANNTLKASQDTVSTMATEQDLAGSSVVHGATDGLVWLEIYRPSKRYIRCKALRGTSTVLGEIYALQYNASAEPVVNVLTGTINGKVLVSPAEGTA
jgi:hypothetical protein